MYNIAYHSLHGKLYNLYQHKVVMII